MDKTPSKELIEFAKTISGENLVSMLMKTGVSREEAERAAENCL